MGEPTPAADRRPAMLREYLRRELSREPAIDAVPRRPAGEAVPLSFGQEQLWFLTQLAPEAPVCNEPLTIRHTGPLDTEALERTLSEMVRRHEVWRTDFASKDGNPLQLIRSAVPWKLRVVDLSELPEQDREPMALRIAAAEASRPFAFDGEPLLRTTLVRLSPLDQRLYVTLHQLAIDCTAIYDALLPELIAIYAAYEQGRPSPLPEPEIQYGDFAYWQRGQLNEETLGPQLAYWRERLSRSAPDLRLPIDRPPPPRRTFHGSMYPFCLTPDLSGAIRTLSNREHVTPFMTLLASFKALLHLYTTQDDVVVGTATAGRKRPELEGLMGYFLNYLVLRTDLSGDPTFRELMRRVRDVTLGALSNDDIPFDHVVRALTPRRASSRNPLFQVALIHAPGLSMAYGSRSSTGAPDAGWTLSQLDIDLGTSKFDLSVDIDDGPELVAGRVFFSTDLFDVATVARMVESWRRLLEAVVADPQKHLSELAPLLVGAGPPDVSSAPTTQQGETSLENEPTYVAPRDEVEQKLVAIWEQELGGRPIGIRDNFFRLGGHSLMAVRIFHRVEQSLGRRLALATLFEAPTVEELARILRQDAWSPRWSALVEIQPRGSRPPFFCVHGHGGHVLLFNDVARALGDHQPFYGIQAVGLDGRASPYRTFEDMAQHYINEMRSVQSHGPYFVGGYCLGGPVAYEMARQLVAQGETVGLVVLFDGFRPGYPRLLRWMPRSLYDMLHRLRIIAFQLRTSLRLGPSHGVEYLLAGARRQLAQTFADPRRPNPLRVTQAALMDAYRAYDPPPYPGRLVLFRARRMPWGIEDSPQMGWSGLARGGVEVDEMPVYYTTEFTGPNAPIVAEKLESLIAVHLDRLSNHPQPITAAAV
jgi:thioesterase domain-containing protein/acyl carrier protein